MKHCKKKRGHLEVQVFAAFLTGKKNSLPLNKKYNSAKETVSHDRNKP